MNVITEAPRGDWKDLMKRPELDIQELDSLVQEVFDAVRDQGDDALLAYTALFDKVLLDSVQVSDDQLQQSEARIAPELKWAIDMAAANIRRFHESQLMLRQKVETMPGVVCWQESRAIERIGIYIPGGSAPLFSTVLMLAIPATIAGCKDIVLCTPPQADGTVHPAILYAAKITGVTQIFRVGGIQAIAAMALGTSAIPGVYKIFGPGNQYVSAAKLAALAAGVAIDLPAGPSEVLVLADETCIPEFVASDLLAQAEHGPDSQVMCLTNNEDTLIAIALALSRQLLVLPRKKIAEQALTHSRLILMREREDTMDFVNGYAPEHLILCTADNDFYIRNLVNAGSVFIGNYTPESAGDYASGTNHTLPTHGYARAYSGVHLDDFTKKITFQEISRNGIETLGDIIEIMAAAEGLQGHRNAVTIRRSKS